MSRIRRGRLTTGGLTLLTAGALTAAGAPSAQADTSWEWVTGGSYTCTVTGHSRVSVTEAWVFGLEVDDNNITWTVGKPVPAQSVSVRMDAPKNSFTRVDGVTALRGQVNVHYTLNGIPITANLPVAWTKDPAYPDYGPYPSGKGQSFTPMRAGFYEGRLGPVTADLTTNTGDARHLHCVPAPGTDLFMGGFYVADPKAPSTTSTHATPAPTHAPAKPTTSTKPATPHHPAPKHPSTGSNASGSTRPAHGPVVSTDLVKPTRGSGIGVGFLLASAGAGVVALRRRPTR